MKKWIVWVILGIILIAIVAAGIILVKYPLDRAAPPSNDSSENLTCAREGEQFSKVYRDEYPFRCCSGLTEWDSGMDTRKSIADNCYGTGLASGYPVGLCINCGNNICEDIESPCNCPEDCTGKNRSTYLTKEDFCKEGYGQYCRDKEFAEAMHISMCSLCN
jgi:hypothetical protein